MIGIFDSGSGGLTVLRALRERSPFADVVYFGDLVHAPYGSKSREELNILTMEGIEFLLKQGADEIVSACNSVSVSITKPLLSSLGIPFEHVIEMAGPTTQFLRGIEESILVVATQATIESGIYGNKLEESGVRTCGLALPDLVPLIEQGVGENDIRSMLVRDLVPHVSQKYSRIVLGCTHFPLVREAFEFVLKEQGWCGQIIDPAHAVADEVAKRFKKRGNGTTRYVLSKQSDVFERRVRQMFPHGQYKLDIMKERV